jgi:FdhD protein
VSPRARISKPDVVAAEEPLEIRLSGSRFVVTMRTPGADRELAAGLLLSEGILRSADDLGSIRHCRDRDIEASGNVVDVVLAGGAVERARAALADRRLVAATSACGVCGRRSIADLMQQHAVLDARVSIAAAAVVSLPARLRDSQAGFDQTGGLHAAGLFAVDGALVAAAEDVGRHNAVDKVIGAELLGERLPLAERVLCVSGRTSFEIVQKAVAAGIPIVAAVSAPSSLAIDLARAARVTLLGFVRDGGFNIYSVPERILC